MVLDNFHTKLVQGEEIFQAVPKWVWFSQTSQKKAQKACNFDQKILMKILSFNPLLIPSKKKFTILRLSAKPCNSHQKEA